MLLHELTSELFFEGSRQGSNVRSSHGDILLECTWLVMCVLCNHKMMSTCVTLMDHGSEVRGHGHAAGNVPFAIQKVETVLRDIRVPFQWLKTTPRFSDTLIPTNYEI